MTESFSTEDRLSELLDYIHNYTRQRRFVAIGAKPPVNDEPFEHIKYASAAFLTGALPDAKTMAFIAYALDKYIRREGNLSLDEAFGLKPKPKAGNPSRKYARNNHLNGKLHDMVWLKANDPNLTVEEAAARVCEDDSEEKEQSTLNTYYKKGKWAQYEKLVRG